MSRLKGSRTTHTKGRMRTQPGSPMEEQTQGPSALASSQGGEWKDVLMGHFMQRPLLDKGLKQSRSEGGRISEIQSTRLHVLYRTE